MEDRKSLTASLLTRHSMTRSHSSKEEVLALLSFERTKMERTVKKYKIVFYCLIAFCFFWTLYNTTFTALWIRMSMIINSEEYDQKCQFADFVVNCLIWIHVAGIIDIFLCAIAAKKEKKKAFFFTTVYLLAQLISRILIYARYLGLTEGNKGCPFEDYEVSRSNTMQGLLIAECACDMIVLATCLHLVWLLNKIKGKQKLLSIVEKA